LYFLTKELYCTILSYLFHFYFHPEEVCLLGICLSVGNFTLLLIRSYMKILPEICLWTWKLPLNFGSYRDLNQDLGIFWSNYYQYGVGNVQHISLITLEVLNKLLWFFFEGWNVSLWGTGIMECDIFPFSALTLLVWWQEACKKLAVGLLMVTVWLQLCTSYNSSCHHHLHHT